ANKASLAKGSPGAPAHFHTTATEPVLVLAGSARFLRGDTAVRLDRGAFLTGAPPVPPAFAPAPAAEAGPQVRLPPGMHRVDYDRLLERVYRGQAAVQEIRDSSQTYDNHYVDSPVWREEIAAG